MPERSSEVNFQRLTKADHNANIVCEAHNQYTNEKGRPVTSQTTQLDVECKQQLYSYLILCGVMYSRSHLN
jgi:hypothetical protein